jgi:hypothetical protein
LFGVEGSLSLTLSLSLSLVDCLRFDWLRARGRVAGWVFLKVYF